MRKLMTWHAKNIIALALRTLQRANNRRNRPSLRLFPETVAVNIHLRRGWSELQRDDRIAAEYASHPSQRKQIFFVGVADSGCDGQRYHNSCLDHQRTLMRRMQGRRSRQECGSAAIAALSATPTKKICYVVTGWLAYSAAMRSSLCNPTTHGAMIFHGHRLGKITLSSDDFAGYWRAAMSAARARLIFACQVISFSQSRANFSIGCFSVFAQVRDKLYSRSFRS